jgi:putative transposase
MAKVPQRLQEPFKRLLDRVMYAKGESDARTAFAVLKTAMSNDAQRAVACIEKDLDSLLVHYQFEQRFWRALRTTNAIERVNKEFKRRSKSMESMGERTQEIMLAFIALRLEMGWRRVSVDSKSMDNLMYVRAADDGENPVEKSLHLLVNKA